MNWILLSLLASLTLFGCGTPTPQVGGAPARSSRDATIDAFEAVRANSGRLYAFLRVMPKGGDLHTHLTGATYAESYLRWAAEDGLCLDTATFTLVAPPCDPERGRMLMGAVQRDFALLNRTIHAFSARHYLPESEIGHERVFSTFSRFSLVAGAHIGDMLAEVAARAASGRVRYLEIMHTAGGMSAANLGARVGWDDDFGRLRQNLLAAGWTETLRQIRSDLDRDEARRDEVLRCGTPQADPGCKVTQRYLYQVLRATSKEMAFAQILAGFELSRDDRRFVGINLVQPEDHWVSMRDYRLHMRMIGFMRQWYPHVRVTLHAGEFGPGLVPTEGTRFHIREAIEVARAERIGHGVSVMLEDDPYQLMRSMAQRKILVEVNLTSNHVILGIRGADHPLRTYLEHGVPVALGTDDEGVFRSEMTLEYQRAVEEQGLGYRDLVAMSRASLQYAFVEGKRLWSDFDALEVVPDCAPKSGGLSSPACRAFTAANEAARLQASLEADLQAFETSFAHGDDSAPHRGTLPER
jgi:adenosine deaminase